MTSSPRTSAVEEWSLKPVSQRFESFRGRLKMLPFVPSIKRYDPYRKDIYLPPIPVPLKHIQVTVIVKKTGVSFETDKVEY